MPKKPAPDPRYGYDPETNTDRVGRHDLARLLLMFRKLLRDQPPGKWRHMDDYDLSFEHLADTVDAGSQLRWGKRWTGPDLVFGQDVEELGGRHSLLRALVGGHPRATPRPRQQPRDARRHAGIVEDVHVHTPADRLSPHGRLPAISSPHEALRRNRPDLPIGWRERSGVLSVAAGTLRPWVSIW
ncbi:hypothetical protein [Streptomyces sp. WAC08241]|uniref:hypothetical protein n=1 Tax=Streptomyces sp. WAC08241 TaxID=2487421 RepID=UPI000F79FF91|nr:hypothetical protein [Streptomyces sp. WAC08241]RSS47085.1 hypothetical protein EF906_00080 [Streptomyces sp. WAC08241]